MTELGHQMNKTAVLQIEKSDRGLSLDEALGFAWALNVAPAHLLTPPEGSLVWPTDELGLGGNAVRNWLNFNAPLLIESTEGEAEELDRALTYSIDVLSQTLDDATRGGDEAGKKQALAALLQTALGYQNEKARQERLAETTRKKTRSHATS